MVIEKIKENKFKILLSLSDLEKENIDFHSFMSSNLDNQIILKKIILKLKSDYNFVIDESKISINAFYICNKDFILIITSSPDEKKSSPRVTVSRYNTNKKDNLNIYRFNNFEEVLDFYKFIKLESNLKYNMLSNCPIYEYNNLYFLVMHQNGISDILYCSIDKYLSEFTFRVNNPNNFYIKLIEYGNIVSI